MNLSIVIPNYNGSDLLKKNLPKVISAAKSAEIIIVDDASTDNSVQMLMKLYPKIKIVRRTKNSGFASSVNAGVKAASNNLVLLLNHDVIPEENFLGNLISHFTRDEKIFAVACLEKSIEGAKTIFRGRGIGGFRDGFLIHRRGEIGKPDTLWVSAGAGMFRKDIWEKLGGMDILYDPFYWEDIDLSYRAMKAGYKIMIENKSKIIHNHSEGSIRQIYSNGYIRKIAYRNQIYFVWLNIRSLSFLAEHFLYLPVHIFRSLIKHDSAFICGLILAVRQLPRLISHRAKNMKLSLISDEEILQRFKD